MLSKNNFQERLRKMERKQERFSIRKLTIGAVSVLIGVSFFAVHPQEKAKADTVTTNSTVVEDAKISVTQPTSKITDSAATSEETTPTSAASSSSVTSSAENETSDTESTVSSASLNSASSKSAASQEAVAEINKSTAPTSLNAVTPKSAVTPNEASAETVKDSAASSLGTTVTPSEASGDSVAASTANSESTNSSTTSSSSAVTNVATLTVGVDASEEAKKIDESISTASLTNTLSTLSLSKVAVTNSEATSNLGVSLLAAPSSDVTQGTDDSTTANVGNFADFSKAITNKNITTISITQDIDLTNMTETESQVDGGLVSGGTGLTGDNWLQPYELAANKTSNSPYTGIARAVTINGNGHTINTGKWFVSLWDQNVGDSNWSFTFNDMKVKSNINSTSYAPFYFGNMSSKNIGSTTLTFNNFQDDLNNTVLTADDVVVIFKGNDVINVPSINADTNIISAKSLLVDDNADVKITTKWTGSDGILSNAQDENHNVIKLENKDSENSGNMTVGKNAKLSIDTHESTRSVRGVASRNTDGTLYLNEGSNVDMNMGKGHSSAVLLSNLILDKNSTLNVNTIQDNSGTTNTLADGSYYAPIGLAVINFSQASKATLKVAKGATLKMTRGNVGGSTPMIMIGGSTVGGNNNYAVDFEDGSTVDIQDGSSNSKNYALIYEIKSGTPIKIGQMKYLNLQKTGNSSTAILSANAGVTMDAGKFGGVDIKQWQKGNTGETPNSTWQVENFSTTSDDGNVATAGMAPVDNSQQATFIKDFNLTGNEVTSGGLFNKTIEKQALQRLVITSMDLEAYNYDARYKDSTTKVGETIDIDSPTFYQVGENGTLTPANPNPDLLDNTTSGHPYQLGWAQTGNVAIPQGTTIDPATGKITFSANQGQVGTVVNIPVTVTYKDNSIDQVIAPVYVLGNDTTPVWQKDANGNTTGAIAIQYSARNLPETTDKSAQVANIAENYKLTYYAIPTTDNPEVTPIDLTNYGKVTWANTPSTVVETPTNNETVKAPVALSFAPDSVAVKNGYVKAGTQNVDLNLDLTGATAKNTDLGFSKKSIENGLTQTQFKRLVDTTALDNAGIDYTLSWAETPTTNAQNNGTVRVTYPSVMQADGTTPAYLDIPVQYKVNDPGQTADEVNVTYPTTATSAKDAATITPVITDNDGKTVDVPAGTKFTIEGTAPAGATIDSTTGVVTIPATNTTGVTTVPVTVTYPDGSTTQTTVKSVSVATNDDVKNPASPYDMIKDPSNLPAGTKVTWADDNTPTAGDNVPAKVIVSVPGADPIEVTGTAHYDDSAIYTPQVKNPVQATPESLPDAAAQIMNMDKLPEGTTAAWQDGQQVPVTADQTIPGVIVVTYPDGSTDKVSTTITTTGITNADQYNPEPVSGLTTTVGKLPEAAKAIANTDEMPTGTTYTWTKEPDVSKAGETTGEVTVTYPDGTTDTVTVPVTVTAEKVDKTALEKAVDEAPEIEKTPAYINGSDDAKKAYDDAVTAGKEVLDNPDATQDQVDNATKAIEDAKKGLDGKIDVTPYEPAASSSADVTSSAADDAKSNASSAASSASTASSAASVASSAAEKNSAAKSDADKASSAASEASSAASKASSAASVASSAASDAEDQKSIASEQDSIASSAASAGDSSAASEAQSKASEAAKKASEDADIAKSAASEASAAQSTASSAASEASSAASAAESEGSSASIDYASDASSASSEAASHASDASSSSTNASSTASEAKSDADKNPNNSKANSAASTASSAASEASSAALIASSAANNASSAASIASSAQSAASSYASEGNSSAASEAESAASSAASQAKSDASVASSAASKASSAASTASSAASDASSATNESAGVIPDSSTSDTISSAATSSASSAASQETSGVKSQADEEKGSTSSATKPVHTETGKVPKASDAVKNLPEGSTVKWVEQPDVSTPGTHTGVVEITYPDGQTEKKTVEVVVRPHATKVNEAKNRRAVSRNRYANNAQRAQWLRDHGYEVVVGPQGEIISYTKAANGEGRIIREGKGNSEDSATRVKSQTLPQTGANQLDNIGAILGLALASVGFIFGLADIKKRKKN